MDEFLRMLMLHRSRAAMTIVIRLINEDESV